MKSAEEVMEILEAFDLTGSYRAAAELVGCDHKTVKHYVQRRDAGLAPDAGLERDRLVDEFVEKVDEWMERSSGRIRADVVHDKLVALGYEGSERTTRRAVAEARKRYRQGKRRVFKPWIPEPGMWLQYDWAHGPRIAGRVAWLFCAWLAWSRYRFVIPVWDKTLPTVAACLDATFRQLGGAPTYVLTDNEKPITSGHVAGLAVRNSELVAIARHYGVAVHTCVPADPQSKGGSEATVRIAKADLVPTEANLLDDYAAFADLEAACEVFCDEVNRRPHRLTGRAPVELLVEERARLHPIPPTPYAAAFGQTRSVCRDSTISVGGVRYSVPYRLVDEKVWVREHGDELVIVHLDPVHGATEVARHRKSTKGHPQICDEHYPPRSTVPTNRQPRACNPEEEAFLALGEGARQWLIEACAAGAHRVPSKMREALTLARLVGEQLVDRGLGVAATYGRFDDKDLAALLDHARDETAPARHIGDGHSLQQGLAGWEALGR